MRFLTGRRQDPYTVLLCHFNGADGATATEDSTGRHILTFNGHAALDSDRSKFGLTSLRTFGDDTIQTPASSDFNFGSGDFTIEWWMNWNSVGAFGEGWMGQYQDASNYWYIFKMAGGMNHAMQYIFWYGGVNCGSGYVNGAWNPSGPVANTWYHFALVRTGTTGKIFINGVEQSLTGYTPFATLGPFSALLYLFAYNSAVGAIDGWMDEVRISKGIARWTTGFTPPTGQYPR